MHVRAQKIKSPWKSLIAYIPRVNLFHLGPAKRRKFPTPSVSFVIKVATVTCIPIRITRNYSVLVCLAAPSYFKINFTATSSIKRARFDWEVKTSTCILLIFTQINVYIKRKGLTRACHWYTYWWFYLTNQPIYIFFLFFPKYFLRIFCWVRVVWKLFDKIYLTFF